MLFEYLDAIIHLVGMTSTTGLSFAGTSIHLVGLNSFIFILIAVQLLNILSATVFMQAIEIKNKLNETISSENTILENICSKKKSSLKLNKADVIIDLDDISSESENKYLEDAKIDNLISFLKYFFHNKSASYIPLKICTKVYVYAADAILNLVYIKRASLLLTSIITPLKQGNSMSILELFIYSSLCLFSIFFAKFFTKNRSVVVPKIVFVVVLIYALVSLDISIKVSDKLIYFQEYPEDCDIKNYLNVIATTIFSTHSQPFILPLFSNIKGFTLKKGFITYLFATIISTIIYLIVGYSNSLNFDQRISFDFFADLLNKKVGSIVWGFKRGLYFRINITIIILSLCTSYILMSGSNLENNYNYIKKKFNSKKAYIILFLAWTIYFLLGYYEFMREEDIMSVCVGIFGLGVYPMSIYILSAVLINTNFFQHFIKNNWKYYLFFVVKAILLLGGIIVFVIAIDGLSSYNLLCGAIKAYPHIIRYK